MGIPPATCVDLLHYVSPDPLPPRCDTYAGTRNHRKQCWGEAVKGQLGQEDGIARGVNVTDLLGDTLPVVPLGDGFEAQAVVSGNEFSCAISVDKAVKVRSSCSSSSLRNAACILCTCMWVVFL